MLPLLNEWAKSKEKIISLENEDCLLFSQWGFGIMASTNIQSLWQFLAYHFIIWLQDLNLAYLRFFLYILLLLLICCCWKWWLGCTILRQVKQNLTFFHCDLIAYTHNSVDCAVFVVPLWLKMIIITFFRLTTYFTG